MTTPTERRTITTTRALSTDHPGPTVADLLSLLGITDLRDAVSIGLAVDPGDRIQVDVDKGTGPLDRGGVHLRVVTVRTLTTTRDES
jgi:hypothetical protein